MSDLNLGTLTAYLGIDATAFTTNLQSSRQQLQQFGQQGARDASSAGTQIGQNLGSGVTAAMAGLALIRTLAPQLNQIQSAAGAAGTQAGQQLGSGITAGTTGALRNAQGQFITAGTTAGTGFGNAAGAGLPPGFTRAVNGTIRNARGQFVSAGTLAGMGYGNAAGPGIQQGIQQGAQQGAQQAQSAATSGGSDFGEKFGDMAKKAIGAAGLAMALSLAMDNQASTGLLQAQLDLSTEDAARFGKLAGTVYADNFGESLEDVKNTFREISSNVGDITRMTDAEVSRYAGKTHNTMVLLGEEAGRTTQLVGTILKNGLAKDADAAFDLITAASQGLSGELQADVIDVTVEYAGFFKQLGINGPQAFGLIRTYADQGAIGMDKIGDALKEFTLLAVDPTRSAAFARIGLDGEEMGAAVARGGKASADAFDQIIGGLSRMSDPLAQSRTAIELFGTPLEDLGVDKVPAFLRALSDVNGGLGDLKGRADEVGDALGTGTGAQMESFTRKIEGIGLKLGDELLPHLEGTVDFLGDVGTAAGGAMEAFSKLDTGTQASIVAFGAMVAFRGPIMSTASSIAGGFSRIASGATSMGSVVGGVGKSMAKGGAIGLAFVAAAVIIGEVVDALGASARKAAAHKAAVDDMAAALIAAGGAFDEAERKAREATFMNSPMFKTALSSGAELQDLMAILSGDMDALGRVQGILASQPGFIPVRPGSLSYVKMAHDQLRDLALVSTEAQGQANQVIDLQKWDAFSVAVDNVEGVAAGLARGLGGVGGAADTAQAHVSTLFADMWEAAKAIPPVEGAATALSKVDQAASDADRALEFLLLRMDELNGVSVTAEEFAAESAAAIRGAGAALDEQASAIRGVAEAEAAKAAVEGDSTASAGDLAAASERVREAQRAVAESSDRVREAHRGVFEQMAATIQRTYDAEVANGNLAGAESAAASAGQTLRQSFVDTMVQTGMTRDAATSLANSLGLIPADTAAMVRTNAGDVKQSVDLLEKTFMSLNGRTITMYANQVNRGGVAGSGVGYAPGMASGGDLDMAPGPKGVDSMIFQGAKGEHVFTAGEVDKLGGQARVYQLRQAIRRNDIPRFAAGGALGNLNLTGATARSAGTRETNIGGALAELGEIIADSISKASDARRNVGVKNADLKDASANAARVAREQAAKVAAAQKSAAEKATSVAEANARKIGAAEAKIQEARKVQGAGGPAAVAKAEAALQKVRDDGARANAKAAKDGAASVAKATEAQKKATTTEEAKVTAARKAHTLATKEFDAANASATAARQAYAAQEKNRRALLSLGRQYDDTTTKLEGARGELESLRSSAMSLQSSVASGLSGTGGGLTGNSEQRKSVGSIINGLGFNQKNVEGFEAQIKKLRALGLSSGQVSKLAEQGFDGAGSTVSTLSGASKGQIAQINKIIAATDAAATRTGKFVANDVFGASVSKQEKAVNALITKQGELSKELSRLAGNIETAVERGIEGSIKKMTQQEAFLFVKKGEKAVAGRGR